jgi:HK97 family phage major capsid protein
MSSKDLLEKVINTTQIGAGSGGILNAKQANRFIDFVFDQSVLMKTARIVRMNEPTIDIDKVDIGQRIMRKATEGTDDGSNADPTFTKISMTTVKLRLDWELTTEGLEDNIEGDSLEDHVASLMARQTANDLEDLLIHGDTTETSLPLIKALNGFRKLARANGVVVDAAGANPHSLSL